MKAKLIRHEKVIDELGNIVEIKLWKVPAVEDKPHGLKYSLVYIADGERVIGFDNAERKGDHKHIGDGTFPYEFKGLEQLAKDFFEAMEEYKGRNNNEGKRD